MQKGFTISKEPTFGEIEVTQPFGLVQKRTFPIWIVEEMGKVPYWKTFDAVNSAFQLQSILTSTHRFLI